MPTNLRPQFALPTLTLCTLTLSALALPKLGWAERPHSLEAGLFGGYDKKSPNNELGNANDRDEVPTAGPGFGARVGYALTERWSVEGEVKSVLSKLRKSGDSAAIFGYRAHAMWHLLTDSSLRPFVRMGVGSDTINTESNNVVTKKDSDTALVAGVGTRYGLTDTFGLRVDLLAALIPGRDSKKEIEPEVWVGVFYLFGGSYKDSDGDGVIDRDDKCKDEAEDPDGWQDEDGCPENDNDGDGIGDAADKCPTQPEVKNGFKDDDGCPDADKDSDGIEDSEDKCPQVAENKNGFEDSDGCPDDPDSDGDGVPDSRDKCPKELETKNNNEDEDGCADTGPDSDGDGIEDTADKCRAEPETKNNYQDSDGCPDKVPEKLKKFAGVIGGIVFDGTSATLAPASNTVLDQIVSVLLEYTDVRIEIGGYTDDQGDAAASKQLSQERADAVRAYVFAKGVAGDRMTAVGYGGAKPLSDNKTDKGRAKNRRIEFKLL